MALEEAIAVQDLYSYKSSIDMYDIFGEGYNWGSECDLVQTEEKLCSLNILENGAENFVNNGSDLSHLLESHIVEQRGCHSSVQLETKATVQEFPQSETSTTISCRPKRRRTRNKRNLEDIENQRMTHIAVERNRRRQINEYLSLLRSLMPQSYVQRVDQASIVGGAINYVKELEHQLQFLSVQNHTKNQNFEGRKSSTSSPFAEFFAFPQYSTSSSHKEKLIVTDDDPWAVQNHSSSAMADIEVSLVENHANIKIRSKSRPRQLVKLLHKLQILRLTILHLSVTSLDQIVLYSLSVKVEDDCKLNSGEEIATAVNQILTKIQMEGGRFSNLPQ